MSRNKRIEEDFIGKKEMDGNVLYGIHSLRAKENFPDENRFHFEWYRALGQVKLACYRTYRQFKKAVTGKYGIENDRISFFDDAVIDHLELSAEEISGGRYFDHFIVPAVSGGAGTSINMNINEIITNASLVRLNHVPGSYSVIDPIFHANIFQSTNDVIPTSLKITAMQLLNRLEDSINSLRASVEEHEKASRNLLRIGYTQLQEAVPSSYGRLFSTYSEALSRDWWRVSKCFERIKVVNLGGSAIGTAITVPRFFALNVVNELQKITKLPVTRSENMQDATCNLDSFVEIHAILKSHAVNLEKMVSDLRLLASDLTKSHEIELPARQTGSSIMPGKVNPVIPEYVISIAHKVYANDSLVSGLCAQGCLDLNAYLPVVGHALLESIKLLTGADITLKNNLFQGLLIHARTSVDNLMASPAITTALLPYIGYHKAAQLAREMKDSCLTVFQANDKLSLMDPEKLKSVLEPQNLLKEGYSIRDILE